MKKSKPDDALKSQLSHNIRQFRIDSGLSQEALAEKAGISVPYLGALERDEKWPSSGTLGNLASSLAVEPYDLFKPESAASREVRKVVAKLTKDISLLVNESVKMLNNISKEGSGANP